ncbi:alpha/beta hydrolase family protein [Actinospica sp.]|uniref:alpha/beta hydrolase family protein n=1 Tax=Actinospica sp. TaxID=1872142 RepID=UPI002C8062F9|nr:prolyl oligopeptidase family serine peptidase [Actinospica sp.]HWG27046.1 prolyl oligopeptidase family serine peptidase [Actinospica sp.]
MGGENQAVTGMAAGVPYVAWPPARVAPGQADALIVSWHLNDPPRSAAAMAAALPLSGVNAWRVYLDLPMHGRRQLPGGLKEFMQLGYQDAVLQAFEPQVTQAVEEFPAVLAALRGQLPVEGGPLGLVGASIGALPAQLVMADHNVRVNAAALVSPVIQLAEVVAVNERRFNVTYPWNDTSREVAARFDLVARAAEIAAGDPQPALLLVTGAGDDPAFPLQTQRLHAELQQLYRDPEHVAVTSIRGMAHGFAAEPGIEPAPQTDEARLVDTAITDWFNRHLSS